VHGSADDGVAKEGVARESRMNWRQRRILIGAFAALGLLWADAFYGLLRTGIQVKEGGGGRFAIEDVRFLAPRNSANFTLLLSLGPLLAGIAGGMFWIVRTRNAGEPTGDPASSLPQENPVATWDGRSKFPGAPEGQAEEAGKARRAPGPPLRLQDLALLANRPGPGAGKGQGNAGEKTPGAAAPEGGQATGRTFDSPAKPDPLGLLDDPFVAAAAGIPEKKPAPVPEARGRPSGRDAKKPRPANRPPDPGPAAPPPSSGKPKTGK
jgi:hypothetical protein